MPYFNARHALFIKYGQTTRNDMADSHYAAGVPVTDERAPLLRKNDTQTLLTNSPSPFSPTPPPTISSYLETPLPVRQVALLCLSRAIETVAFFTIFPFVNSMLYDIVGVPTEEVGFWSGWIVSTHVV